MAEEKKTVGVEIGDTAPLKPMEGGGGPELDHAIARELLKNFDTIVPKEAPEWWRQTAPNCKPERQR